MKKLFLLILLSGVFVFGGEALAVSRNYGAISLTGGGTGALDAIDGDNLNDLDAAFVNIFGTTYTYTLDDDSGAAESSPDVISPDTNAGTKRWILQSAVRSKITISDSASVPPMNLTERSAEPSAPVTGDVYLDDGTNTGSTNPGLRRYTGAAWEDVNEEDNISIDSVAVVDPDFQSGGDIDFVDTSNVVTGNINADVIDEADINNSYTLAGNPVMTISHVWFATTGIIAEGATVNTAETLLTFEDPTADRTITFPNATGTVVLKDSTDTLTNKTIDANGTGNSISNIEIADLANGTDGQLITWDAAGVPAVVATGSATQILTSNGPGTAPTFQSGGGGGDNISIDSVAVVDPDFQSGGDIDFVDTSNVVTGNINADVIDEADINNSYTLAGSPVMTISHVWFATTGIIAEGATVNTAETLLTFEDPTTDRTITFPNESGTVITSSTVASATVSGVVELATATEIDTGTDSTRAMPIDQFVASDRNIRFIAVRIVGAGTDVAVDTTVGGDFVVPFTGTILQSDTDTMWFSAATDTAGTTGTMVVDVHLNGTTICTTNKLDIETTEKGTTTAATQPDLTTTAISAGDILTFDIDAVHTTAAKGLTIYLAIRQS
jgi:hypothetical protein